jgi:hypothetical protein
VEFTVTPLNAGKVVDNVFMPERPGKAIITARAGSAEGRVEINVLDKAVALETDTDSITLGFNDKYDLGRVLGIDKDGNSAGIPWKYIGVSYRNRVGKVEDGIFTSNMSAVINRLTALYRKTKFYDKYFYSIIVSGFSGSDLIAHQLISALNINKTFMLPPKFALMETANNPGDVEKIENIREKAKEFAENIILLIS